MKKISGPKFVLLFVVLCAGVAWIFLYAMNGAYKSRPQLAIPDLSNKRYNPKIYDIREKLQNDVPLKIQSVETDATKTQCQVTFAELLKSDFGSNTDLLIQSLEAETCFAAAVFSNKGNLNKANLLQQCQGDVTKPTCQQAAVFFKVGLLDYLTQNTDLHELTEQQLVAKFLAQFDPKYIETADAAQSEAHYKTMKSIAVEMLKRNPAEPQYQDAFFQSEMIPNMQQNGAQKYSAEFDDLLKQKLQERPYDEKLQEYLFVRTLQESLEAKLKQAEGIFAQNPDSSIAAYQLSALYLKMGDVLQAEKYLQRAVVLNPDSTRFKETLRRFQAGERSGIHTLTLNWGMST